MGLFDAESQADSLLGGLTGYNFFSATTVVQDLLISPLNSYTTVSFIGSETKCVTLLYPQAGITQQADIDMKPKKLNYFQAGYSGKIKILENKSLGQVH